MIKITIPTMAIANPMKILDVMRSFNTRGENNATQTGVVVTRITELAILVSSSDLIHTSEMKTKK
jgi:hypothetical protein